MPPSPPEPRQLPHGDRLTLGQARLAAQALWASLRAEPTIFLGEVLSLILDITGGDEATVVRADAGRWVRVAQTGSRLPLPLELLGEVADRESASGCGSWVAAPLEKSGQEFEILVLHAPADKVAAAREAVEVLSPILTEALSAAREHRRERRRADRLEAILDISQEWNRTHEMEPLLKKIAEAATRLLGAERASIFLWDRESKTLVGRPALGVQNELRVPEDAGVVGRVLQTGQPRRLNAAEAAREVNRNVDQQLKFQTSNLLAVPLHSSSREIVGVFEVLNKRGGDFTTEDETTLGELAIHAALSLENTQRREELAKVKSRLKEQTADKVTIIGESPAIETLRSTVRRVANTELAVLLLGENGSGKEVVSQCIHVLSRRKDEPFIAVNCGAIAETLLESELFGHEKGAFTDAHEARPGKFELASGGTLFLDEIGDMSLSGQSKLLRVLEEKVVVRVGGSKTIRTDARVIAATNRNLVEMVRAKKFREDLYFRLNVVTIQLPPLRERGDDILLLAQYFLTEFCRRAHRTPPKFTTDAKKRLLQHAWPGNIRELRNLMERLAYLSPGDVIDTEEFAFILPTEPAEANATTFTGPLAEATDQFQIEFIQQTIKRCRGNMTDAAERLGLHRSNLYRKMRQLDMQTNEE